MVKDVHYTDPSRLNGQPEYDEQTTSDYVNNLQPVKDHKRKSKRNLTIFILLLGLAIVGAAVYFFFFKPKEPQQQAPQTSQQTQSENQPVVPETENYKSTDLQLSFDYPKDWKIEDSTKGLITVTSPILKLPDINGKQSDSRVVVTFLSAGSEVPVFSTSSGIAVQDSDKITYTSPSQNQRQQTYHSFVGFGKSGLDAVFITGDSGYKKDQIIPESDIKKIEPIIIVTFYGCKNDQCVSEGSESLTIPYEQWASNQMLQAAQNVLKSLRVE